MPHFEFLSFVTFFFGGGGPPGVGVRADTGIAADLPLLVASWSVGRWGVRGVQLLLFPTIQMVCQYKVEGPLGALCFPASGLVLTALQDFGLERGLCGQVDQCHLFSYDPFH